MKHPRILAGLLLSLAAPLAAAVQARTAAPPLAPAVRTALEQVRAAAIRAHVRFLADDALQGRETGAPGTAVAARYLASQLEQDGLLPAGDNGSFFQRIPFHRLRLDTEHSTITLRGAEETRLAYGRDFLLNGSWKSAVSLDAPLVFGGYGITAPEFDRDDYKDLDVKGKLVVVLAGEPASFGGKKQTRHASGQVKARLAWSHGAAGVITLLTGPGAASFSWEEVRRDQTRPEIRLDPAGNAFPLFVVRNAAASSLFEGAPSTWEQVRAAAAEGEANPFPLSAAAHLAVALQDETVPDANVAGLVEGSDPELKKQVVLFTAHYDHVGKGQGQGDTIHNGAWDNASGTAEVLEVAHALSRLRPAPKRSVLFLFLTGEEKGLLGSEYYVRRPRFPLAETAADLNLDMADIFGIPREIVPQGAEQSTLLGASEAAARELNLRIGRDPTPELHAFTRSDQFSFVQAGIPSLLLRWANEYEDVDSARARARAARKLKEDYHQVTDEFDPSWSWEGMRRHAQAALLIGLHVANDPEMPSWKPGSRYAKPRGSRPAQAAGG